jgi:GNAT superfamily N-acetyltransferase
LNSDQLKIKKIKIKQLDEFACSCLNEPAFEEVAPISILRAKSQSKNPQAEPDDIALLVAMHEGRCVGYHGLLPGLIKNKDSVSKFYWLVTFYLAAAFRGKGYGKRLVTEIQHTKVDLVTTGITAAAAGVYRSEGFRQLGELPYYQLRPQNSEVLSTALQNLKPRAKVFTSKSVTQLAPKIAASAAQRESIISFQRDIQTINWMIGNPWVISRQDDRQDVDQYYFSRVRDLFEFVSLEIFAPDGIAPKGYLVLSISRNKNRTTIKLLDYYFHDSNDLFIAAYLTLKYANEYRADRLEFPVGLKNFWQSQTGLTQRVKKKKRLYLFYPRSNSSPLARLANKIQLDYCDSDTAFT